MCPICVAYVVFEIGSAAYDAYQTYKAFKRGAGEGVETLQAALFGAIAPGPGTAYLQAGRALDRLSRIERSFANITAELKTHNHFRAARLELTGRLDTGYDHVQELTEMASGLRNYAVQLKEILGNPAIDDATRARAQELLSGVSSLRDRIMETLRP